MLNLLLFFLAFNPQALESVCSGFFHTSAFPLHFQSCGISLFSSDHALNNQEFQGRMLSLSVLSLVVSHSTVYFCIHDYIDISL